MLKSGTKTTLVTAYILRYIGDSFFFCFFQVFMLSKGLAEDKIGILMSFMPFVAVCVAPLWSGATHNIRSMKIALVIMSIIEGVMVVIFGNISLMSSFVIVIILISIVDNPFYSLLDGYTTIYAHYLGAEYSSIRKYGSIAYIIGSVLGSLVISHWGYEVGFLIGGLTMISVSIMLSSVPVISMQTTPKDKVNLRAVITDKRLLCYVGMVLTIITTAGVCGNFFNTYLVERFNFNDAYCGYLKAVEVCFEVLSIVVLGKFGSKINVKWLYVALSACYLLKCAIVPIGAPLGVTLAVSCVQGFAFGTYIHVHYKHFSSLVGEKLLTAAILCQLIAHSILLSLGNILIGKAITTYGYATAYLILTAITFVGFSLFTIGAVSKKDFY